MDMLLDNEGFAEATDVLVVGDSTGGVATMQMIDDLHAQVRLATRVSCLHGFCHCTNLMDKGLLRAGNIKKLPAISASGQGVWCRILLACSRGPACFC